MRLTADFAFVKAWKGDRWGNLVYRKTARNFNPMMATAAKITIAEVEQLVEVGELDPDQIHTPGIYVKRIFQGELYEKRIERQNGEESGSESRSVVSCQLPGTEYVYSTKPGKDDRTNANASCAASRANCATAST